MFIISPRSNRSYILSRQLLMFAEEKQNIDAKLQRHLACGRRRLEKYEIVYLRVTFGAIKFSPAKWDSYQRKTRNV